MPKTHSMLQYSSQCGQPFVGHGTRINPLWLLWAIHTQPTLLAEYGLPHLGPLLWGPRVPNISVFQYFPILLVLVNFCPL